MIELQGKYNTAKVFTDTAEPSAITQIVQQRYEEIFDNEELMTDEQH